MLESRSFAAAGFPPQEAYMTLATCQAADYKNTSTLETTLLFKYCLSNRNFIK